ncbi:unnamed protein product [Amoebophrya sp. A120]|nr:unnamed protein product [Amoebophrya sp. A120]|eukprot:GSA120T00023530001.1
MEGGTLSYPDGGDHPKYFINKCAEEQAEVDAKHCEEERVQTLELLTRRNRSSSLRGVSLALSTATAAQKGETAGPRGGLLPGGNIAPAQQQQDVTTRRKTPHQSPRTASPPQSNLFDIDQDDGAVDRLESLRRISDDLVHLTGGADDEHVGDQLPLILPPLAIGDEESEDSALLRWHRANKLMFEFRNISFEAAGSSSSSGKKTSTAATGNRKSKKPKKLILDNCFGCFRPGEVTALIGPSGAGKSSLMNLLAARVKGLEKLRKNAVRYGERGVTGPELQDSVAYVLQDDVFFPHQTVRETLDFYARLRLPPSTSYEQRRENVEEVLRTLQLSHIADQLVGDQSLKTISGGERKRVAVGCELIRRPTVLMLDEPTSGLDSLSALKLLVYLKEIAVAQHAIIVCTLHQPEAQVWDQVDRVLCMREGRVLFQGWTRETSGLDRGLSPAGREDETAKELASSPNTTSGQNGSSSPTRTSRRVAALGRAIIEVDTGAPGISPAPFGRDNPSPTSGSRGHTSSGSAKKDLSVICNFLQTIGHPMPAGYGCSDWLVYLAQTVSDAEADFICEQTAAVFEISFPPVDEEEAGIPLIPPPDDGDVAALSSPEQSLHGRKSAASGSTSAFRGSPVNDSSEKDWKISVTSGQPRVSSDQNNRHIETTPQSVPSSYPARGSNDALPGGARGSNVLHLPRPRFNTIKSEIHHPTGSRLVRAQSTLSQVELQPVRNLIRAVSLIKDNRKVGCPLTALQRAHAQRPRNRRTGYNLHHEQEVYPRGQGDTSSPETDEADESSSTHLLAAVRHEGSSELNGHRGQEEDKSYVRKSLPPFFTNQFPALLARILREDWRRKTPMLMRFLSPAVQTAIMGAVFWQMGTDLYNGRTVTGEQLQTEADFASAIVNLNGATLNTYTVLLFTAAGQQVSSLGRERPMFLREYTSGMYSLWTYLLVRMIAEIVVMPLQVGLIYIILYFTLGLGAHTAPWWIMLSMFLTGLAGGSIGLFLASATANLPGTAIVWAPFVLTTIPNSFANPFRPISQIPKFISWLQWLVPIRFAYNLQGWFLFSELGKDLKFAATDPARADIAIAARDSFFESESTVSDIGLYLGAIVALLFGFRLFAGSFLLCNSQKMTR